MDLARHNIRVNSLTPTATDVEEGLGSAPRRGAAVQARNAVVLIASFFLLAVG